MGNPGRKYKWTRHNLGFLVVEEFVKKNKIVLRLNRNFNAIVGEGRISGRRIFLAMPQTYMNLSGLLVRDILKYLRIDLDSILVVCDDINLPFGLLRLKAGGSSGGHKGLLSIIESLGTQDFPRLRIGILNKKVKDLNKFLLTNFTKLELKKIKGTLRRATDACESWLENGIVLTMNEFNIAEPRRTERGTNAEL